MFMDKLLTIVLPLLEYMRRAIWLSAISTVILSPNLFAVKIAALTVAFEIYGHFKTEKRTLEKKAQVYFIDCDLFFHHKERALIERYQKILRSLRTDK